MRQHMLGSAHMREKLLDYEGMAADCNMPVRTLRWLVQTKKVPVLVLGHKLRRFQPSRVFEALEKFEVREATRSERCAVTS